MTEQPLKGIKVAFLHPRLEGGGSERVSLTTAKRFAQWGIHSTFIGGEHFPKEFTIPEDLNASIYMYCLIMEDFIIPIIGTDLLSISRMRVFKFFLHAT